MAQSFTVQKLAHELTCALKLRESLAAYDDDPSLIATAIEGETDLHEAILVIAEEIAEAETMSVAISTRINQLNERGARYEKKSEALRALIASTMDRAGIAKITSPEATISLRAGKPGIRIIDDARLPAEAFIQPAPKLSMTRLRELMELAGVTKFEGAEWTNGAPTLAIRRK